MKESLVQKECYHCKETSHTLNLTRQENEELENEVARLQTHFSSVYENLSQKQEDINILLTQIHQQEEDLSELLVVRSQNVSLIQENLQKNQEIEDGKELIRALNSQFQVAVNKNQEDDIMISNLHVKLKTVQYSQTPNSSDKEKPKNYNADWSSVTPQKNKNNRHSTSTSETKHNRSYSSPSILDKRLEDIFNKHRSVITRPNYNEISIYE
ncbi:MAG: hypothetical protein ACH349_07260 [Candidatus Rhabdochlamydia sp.]